MRAVGAAADAHGNGIVELTNRANFQIRGMRVGKDPRLISGLVDAGLAPNERWADDTRNVLINPSAGYDPSDLIDVRPIAHRILEQLTTDPRFAVLSPKFSMQIDGGGSMSVSDHPHDIWMLAVEIAGHGPMLKIGLAGSIDYTSSTSDVRFIEPETCLHVIGALLEDFVEIGVRDRGASRMRDLIAATGRGEIWRRIDVRFGRRLPEFAGDLISSRAVPPTRPPLGSIAQHTAGLNSLGAMPPLGRIGSPGLAAVARVADNFGAGEIRLTPWRSFLIPNVATENADAGLQALRAAGLIVSDDNPMARMIACSGRVGCSSGLANVQADAALLAKNMRMPGPAKTVHLSGCSKSCAVPGTSDVTLVAVGTGSYDLYRRDPSVQGRFGARIAAGIDIDGVADALAGERA